MVEDALGVFGGFVAHEAVNEGEGGLGDEYAGEGPVEEVGVLRDRLLVTGFAELEEYVKVVVCSCCVGLEIVEFRELRHLVQVVIAAVKRVLELVLTGSSSLTSYT